jgi:hypothetical protein
MILLKLAPYVTHVITLGDVLLVLYSIRKVHM